MKLIGDIKKFSFGELTSNNTGKTSGSGTAGLLICLIGGLCFLYGCIIKDTSIINPSVFVITTGAGLLGYRKSKEDAAISTDAAIEEKEVK